MALYCGEGQDFSCVKVLCIQKKVIRLITGIKNMNPVERNLKKIEFLWQLHCMLEKFCASERSMREIRNKAL